jgi:VWFA-related protein
MTSTPRRRRTHAPGSRLVLAGLALAAALQAADPPPPSPPAGTFGEAAEVRVVEVPVQVTRDGKPVRGLTAADFEVFAGKQRQPIVGFEVVDAGTLATPGAPAVNQLPVAGRRHVLFLFDLSYSDPRTLAKAKQAALGVSRDSLQPADLAAVASISPNHGPRLLLGFTSDRAQVELAISAMGSTELVEHRPDYLGLMLETARERLGTLQAAVGDRMSIGQDGETVTRPHVGTAIAAKEVNDTLLLESMQERDLAAGQRDRVQRFTKGLTDLAALMQQLQGRKHVVLLSRGFDSSLLTGQHTPEGREVESADDELREIVRTDSDRRWGNTRLQRALQESLVAMKRADCAIHAIDISGAEVEVRDVAGEARQIAERTPGSGRGSESLFVMADETGGTFHRNFNDLAAAIGQVLEATSVTYVLSIQPQATVAKDGYVPLRVAVPQQRGTEVSYRPGYFEKAPPAVQGALQERLKIASLLLSGKPGGAVRGALLAIPSPWGAPGAQAVVEIDGPSLLQGHVGDVLSAEVTLYAFDAEGTIHDFARQLVGMDLRTVGERLRAHGVRLLAVLDLPPGSYDLRALVRNTVTGRYGVATGKVVLPSAGSGESGVAAVFVQPHEQSWLLVRPPAEGTAPPPYPFAVGEQVLVPVSARLRPGEPATLWLQSWPAGASSLTALVRRTDGSIVGPGELRLGEREPGTNGERALAGFVPPSLSPGAYVLEVQASLAGAAPTNTQLSFVVE